MNLLSIAIALAAQPPAIERAPPATERWVAFFEHAEGGVSSWDAGSVERDGSRVRVRVRWDMAGVANAPFRMGRLHNEIDCAARTGRILSFAAYGPDGAVLVSEDRPGDARPLRSGTPGDGLYRALCDGDRPRASPRT